MPILGDAETQARRVLSEAHHGVPTKLPTSYLHNPGHDATLGRKYPSTVRIGAKLPNVARRPPEALLR